MADSGTGVTVSPDLLLSMIEDNTCELSSLHTQFCSYFKPLEPKIEVETLNIIQSLPKNFFHNAIFALYQRNIKSLKTDNYPSEPFFDIFQRCLSYVEVFFASKSNHEYHVWLIWCYINWGKLDDAKFEALNVLDMIQTFLGTTMERVVPDLGKVNGDKDVALIIIQAVVLFLKCVADVKSTQEIDYRLLLCMVEEIHPWLCFFDEEETKKFHTEVATHLRKCTLFLAREHRKFDKILTLNFCVVTIFKHTNWLMNSAMQKILQAICTPFVSNYHFCCKVFNLNIPSPTALVEMWVQEVLLKSRASGVEGLNRCITYVDKVISLIDEEDCGHVCHLLAEALCLRAFCKQDANPHSQNFVEDVKSALKTWLRLEDYEQTHLESQYTLNLLYRIVDLLSLTVYMEDHSDIFTLMISLCTRNNFSLKECVSMLWQSRSLNHSLCLSPVSDAFITTLSNQTKSSNSIEFWMSCMDRSKALEVGFQHNFSVLSSVSSTNSDVTIDQLKKAASDLSKKDHGSAKSKFLEAQLYYDMCERLVAEGSMIEAHFNAKKAFDLRYDLFRKYYKYSTVIQNCEVNAVGEVTQKSGNKMTKFYMDPKKAWSFDFEDFFLTPYNVLRKFLESSLQAGTVNEILGNGLVAENNLTLGRNLSSFHGLTIFTISFSSALGKLYSKQNLWLLAEKEIESAKNIFAKNGHLISCLKCRLIMEVTLDQELGDISIARCKNTTGNDEEYLQKAESSFNSVVEKLKLYEWKSCVSNPEEVTESDQFCCDTLLLPKKADSPKTSRKRQKRPKFDYIDSCRCEVTCVCDDVNCWHCVPYGVMKSKSMISIIQMKWECTRRNLLLRQLIGRGKWLVYLGKNEIAYDVYMESISLLVTRSTFWTSQPSISFSYLIRFIEKNATVNFFGTELAQLLYYISMLSLKVSFFKGERKPLHGMSIPIETLVDGLKLAFILSKEVPEVFQKVSQLLALLYTLSATNKEFLILSSSTGLSASQWAGFFHQAAIGTSYMYSLYLTLQKAKNKNNVDVNGSSSSSSISWHRMAPDSLRKLEKFVSAFFKHLPTSTIVCVNISGDGFGNLLEVLLHDVPSSDAWIMFSRFNSHSSPLVICLPINSISEGKEEDPSSGIFQDKKWTCPWGHTIVDEVAPLLRTIVKGCAVCVLRDVRVTDTNRELYNNRRTQLNRWLDNFLSKIEDEWFGPWKHLLLGDSLDHDDHIIIKNGCYIGKREHSGIGNINSDRDLKTKPIILVPDIDIQMLPWESIPILINREVYRMPSIANIFCTYYTCRHVQTVGDDSAAFAMIDPLDTYYLLTPDDSTLEHMGDHFKKFFDDLNIQGTHRKEPSKEELHEMLLKKDMYIYIGHDSGSKYFGVRDILGLDSCPAAFITGCSSGVLYLNGSYAPSGGSLYYVLGGAPILLSHLWNVVSNEIINFNVDFFGALIEERERSGNRESNTSIVGFASFMGHARNACKHRFLHGAGTVCYGIPTRIIKKKN